MERQRPSQENLPSLLSQQRSQGNLEGLVDLEVLEAQVDQVGLEDPEGQEDPKQAVREHQQSQLNQQRNQAHQEVRVARKVLVVLEALGDLVALEDLGVQEVLEDLEGQAVQEDQVDLVVLQQHLQEHQPRRRHQLLMPQGNPMALEGQGDLGDPEDPVAQEDLEDLVDQEGREVMCQ